MDKQVLHDAIAELIELFHSVDVDKLPEATVVPLVRVVYQLCGAIVAAKSFDE